jgi:hypothetical protein
MVAMAALLRNSILTALLFQNNILVSSTTSLPPATTNIAEGAGGSDVIGECNVDNGDCPVVADETTTRYGAEKGPPPSSTTQCGVYLAQSTLPGTGIGMFAGKNFAVGESIMAAGDHM